LYDRWPPRPSGFAYLEKLGRTAVATHMYDVPRQHTMHDKRKHKTSVVSTANWWTTAAFEPSCYADERGWVDKRSKPPGEKDC
jgi:hypothetical protein